MLAIKKRKIVLAVVGLASVTSLLFLNKGNENFVTLKRSLDSNSKSHLLSFLTNKPFLSLSVWPSLSGILGTDTASSIAGKVGGALSGVAAGAANAVAPIVKPAAKAVVKVTQKAAGLISNLTGTEPVVKEFANSVVIKQPVEEDLDF